MPKMFRNRPILPSHWTAPLPLTTRIVAICLVVVAIATIIVGATSMVIDHHQEQRAAETRAATMARDLAYVLSPDTNELSREHTMGIVQSGLMIPEIQSVQVYDANRQILTYSDKTGAPAQSYRLVQEPGVAKYDIRRNVWQYTAPIYSHAKDNHPSIANATPKGYVQISMTIPSQASFLEQAFLRAMVGCGLMLAFTVPLLFLSVRQISGPLRRLVRLADQVHLADKSAQSRSRKVDEIEHIGLAMAGLVARMDDNNASIRKLAFIDNVTGLPNRVRLLREIDLELSQSNAEERLSLVFVFEIEKFARVLQSMPRGAADEILLALGQILKRITNAVDPDSRDRDAQAPIAARIAEHQFGVFLPNAGSRSDSARKIQEVAAALRTPLQIQGHQVNLRVSAGAAYAPDDGNSAEELLHNAITALTHAIQEGGGRARVYGRNMNDHARNKVELEAAMRLGVQRGEFMAYFQPKVDLATGEIVGAEALARWRNSKGVLISPADFIPLAEETGLIGAIGEAILHDACRHATLWPDLTGHPLRLAVNVSPVQFEDDHLADRILTILESTKFCAEHLEIEITESVAVDDPQRVAQLTSPLKDRGVRLAIDDFGSGHSNLVALTRLPFDVFKIDQQFTKSLGQDLHAPAIIEMILALAASLNYETVAEGVETARQAAFLRRRGCTIGQGYLYAKPLPADQFVAFLRDWDSRPEQPQRAIA